MAGQVRQGGIVVLDFGGQYAHLIARRVRECGAYSEILPPDTPAATLKGVAGIILSGGPQSVYADASPQADRAIFDLGVPILGICYGHQWLAHALGGKVQPGKTKEYGSTALTVHGLTSTLFQGAPEHMTVWMSHGDTVISLPAGFAVAASSQDCAIAAMEDPIRKIYGVQFHLEVVHTPLGKEILCHFVQDICKAPLWSLESYAQEISEQIVREVRNKKVFMLVSGGVDSTVAFTLLNKTLGPARVFGLLIDTGLMRKNEAREMHDALAKLGYENLHVENASEEFFQNLHGVCDPEEKRRIIGQTFLDVQQRVAAQLPFDGLEPAPAKPERSEGEAGWILGQGTIYPDTIETGGTQYADQIKTHHNRIEQIQRMIEEGRVIEPLKELYKDEVRRLGEELGLPHALVWRHPFPGPGLAVRILCCRDEEARAGIINPEPRVPVPHAALPILSVGVQGDSRTYRAALALFTPPPHTPRDIHWDLATRIPNELPAYNRVLLCLTCTTPSHIVSSALFLTHERAELLREADAIVDQEMRRTGLYETVWQFPVVLLPVGAHPGGQSLVLRPVESTEAMTANAARLPENVLIRITERLVKLPGIDFVFDDLTSKPPATIEWE